MPSGFSSFPRSAGFPAAEAIQALVEPVERLGVALRADRRSRRSSPTPRDIRTSCRSTATSLWDLAEAVVDHGRRRRQRPRRGRGQARRQLLPGARRANDRGGAALHEGDGRARPGGAAVQGRCLSARPDFRADGPDPSAPDRQGTALYPRPRPGGLHGPAVRPLHATHLSDLAFPLR